MTLGSAGSVLPSDLRGLTRFLTRTNATKFSDVNIDALLNLNYHRFVNEILRAGGDVDFNTETEEIDLVSGTQTYSIAGKVLSVRRMEVKMDGANFRKVNFFDLMERGLPSDSGSLADFTKDAPFGDLVVVDEVVKVTLYPIPDAAVTNGLKVWKVLEITELATANAEPSIPEAYQPYLSHKSAADWFRRQKNRSEANDREVDAARLLADAKQFYSNRNEDENYGLGSVYEPSLGE